MLKRFCVDSNVLVKRELANLKASTDEDFMEQTTTDGARTDSIEH